jgi:hypothetical protein
MHMLLQIREVVAFGAVTGVAGSHATAHPDTLITAQADTSLGQGTAPGERLRMLHHPLPPCCVSTPLFPALGAHPYNPRRFLHSTLDLKPKHETPNPW